MAYGPPAATCHHTVTAELRVVAALMPSEVENTDLSLGRECEPVSLISPSRAGSVTEMCYDSMSNKLIRDLPGAKKKKCAWVASVRNIKARMQKFQGGKKVSGLRSSTMLVCVRVHLYAHVGVCVYVGSTSPDIP